MAGFFSAHATWSVCDGEVLVPIGACELSAGERKMNRFVDGTLEEAASRAQSWAIENPEGARSTVAIHDGYVSLSAGKTDALLVLTCFFEQGNGAKVTGPERRLLMAIPYRSAKSAEGFAVFRPKFLEFNGEAAELDPAAEAFFQGVDQREKGASVWKACLDQSQ